MNNTVHCYQNHSTQCQMTAKGSLFDSTQEKVLHTCYQTFKFLVFFTIGNGFIVFVGLQFSGVFCFFMHMLFPQEK